MAHITNVAAQHRFRALGAFLLLTALGVVAVFFPRASAQEASPRTMTITTSSPEALELYHEARHFMDRAQPESARPLLQRALELDPDFMMALDALRGTAASFVEVREVQARLAEKLPDAELSPGERMHFDASLAAQVGDRERWLQLLEQLAEHFPDDPRRQYNLALFHFGRDNETAAALLTSLTERHPAFVPAYNILGYAHKNLGRMDHAEAAFQKAIELAPDNPNAHDSFGELLLALGRHEESIESYDKTLALEPLFPSAQIGVASNLILLGRHDEARRRLDALAEIAPHDGMRSGIHWARAVTYADEEDLPGAIRELEENLRLSAKGGDHAAMAIDKSNLAFCLIEMGEYHRAKTVVDEALQHRLTITDGNQLQERFARFNHAALRVRIAVADGDVATAGEYEARASALADTLETLWAAQIVHELRAQIAMATEDYETAVMELEQADSDEVYNMFRLGQAHEKLGHAERAADYYNWVVGYNSPLNFNYSFVRHRAAERAEALGRP